MEIKDILTLLGIFVSYIGLYKKIDGDIKHSKEINTISKLEDSHYIILEMILVTLRNNESMYRTVMDNVKFYNKIYAYGSLDSIKIIASLYDYLNDDRIFKIVDRNTEIEIESKVISYNLLLATQIKYDVTGHIINPKYWLIITKNIEYWDEKYMTDMINEIIKELDLNKSFKIDKLEI